MTIYNFIEQNIKYIVLSINFEHKKYGNDIKLNTNLDSKSGFSCCWNIGKDRVIQKVIIYLKHNKEIYIADFIRKEQQNNGRYKIYFENTKLIGLTTLNWKDFVNNGVGLRTSRRYIEFKK